jgi:hypothetical protein
MSRRKYSYRAELASFFGMSVANSIEENSRARAGARPRLCGAALRSIKPVQAGGFSRGVHRNRILEAV